MDKHTHKYHYMHENILFLKRESIYHPYFIFKYCVHCNYNCTLIEIYIKRFFSLPLPMSLRLHAVATMSTHSSGSIIL